MDGWRVDGWGDRGGWVKHGQEELGVDFEKDGGEGLGGGGEVGGWEGGLSWVGGVGRGRGGGSDELLWVARGWVGGEIGVGERGVGVGGWVGGWVGEENVPPGQSPQSEP